MSNTYRKIILILFIFSNLIFGCINDKSRKDHKYTFKIKEGLYAEIFSTFGQGALGGDRDGKWLTDSTNFRIFLGVYDDIDGRINIEFRNDSVFVTQFPDNLDVNKDLKKPITKTYLLKELKQLNNLNDF